MAEIGCQICSPKFWDQAENSRLLLGLVSFFVLSYFGRFLFGEGFKTWDISKSLGQLFVQYFSAEPCRVGTMSQSHRHIDYLKGM